LADKDTMLSTSVADLDPETIAAFSRARGETQAALDWRQRAAETLDTVAYPDRVKHLWRYTDPDLLKPASLLSAAPEMLDLWTEPTDPAVLLTAGAAPRLNAAAEECGLEITSLFANDDHADVVGSAVPADHGWFEAINAAAFDAGLAIRAPKGLVLERPLRVVIPCHTGSTQVPRLLVLAEAGSEITVVEEHRDGGPGSIVIGVTEIVARAGSHVRHVLVQRWADGVRGHLTQRALIERDADYLGALAGLGGELVKIDQGGILSGKGARSELVGVTLPEKRQHQDHHTEHRHTSGNTSSKIDFKAAVTDRARSVYTGLIRIDEGAPASEAFQENRNLLLSEKARADTIPELEILTDDVSCSHGATAAPIDPEQVFYLQSRGMPHEEATRLVVRGFVESTLRLVPEGLREELEELVEDRLRRLQGVA